VLVNSNPSTPPPRGGRQDNLDIQAASAARIDTESIEGAYTFIYEDKSTTRFCRIMIESDKVWVRVGGGFESLDE
jgi:hypothetical protein